MLQALTDKRPNAQSAKISKKTRLSIPYKKGYVCEIP